MEDDRSSLSDWESLRDDDVGEVRGRGADIGHVDLELSPGGLGSAPSPAGASTAATEIFGGDGDRSAAGSSMSSFVPVSRSNCMDISSATSSRRSEPSSGDDLSSLEDFEILSPSRYKSSDRDDPSSLVNYEIISPSSGEAVRRCERRESHDGHDSITSASCDLALLANPDVEIDAQIALQQKRKEEQDATAVPREDERKRDRIRTDSLYEHACILAGNVREIPPRFVSGFHALPREDLEGRVLEFIKQAVGIREPKEVLFGFKCTSRTSLESITTDGFPREHSLNSMPGEVGVSYSLRHALDAFNITLGMIGGEPLRPILENGIDGREPNSCCLCWIVAVLNSTDSAVDWTACPSAQMLPLAYFDSSLEVDGDHLDPLLDALWRTFLAFSVENLDLGISATEPLQKKDTHSDNSYDYQRLGKGCSGVVVGDFTPDSKWLVSGRDEACKVWAPRTNVWDYDNYGYIIFMRNETIHGGRYRLQRGIGKGSCSQVIKAFDTSTHEEVAIKIFKNRKHFLRRAKTEIRLLAHLNENDKDDRHNIVRVLSTFMFRNHQCIVFEMLSLNLHELLRGTHFAGVSLNLVRRFGEQILRALAYLARPDIDVIHGDLKPEHILLRHPRRGGIKVADFGSSFRGPGRMHCYAQSQFYRSPEVMLGLPSSAAIDVWSLGCILVEMHTGVPLFLGTGQFDQMRKIVEILGMIPHSMLLRADEHRRAQFFELSEGRWSMRQRPPDPSSSRTSVPTVPGDDPVASLRDIVGRETGRKEKYSSPDVDLEAREYRLFVGLVQRMLALRPEDRIRPAEALEHPFITEK